MDEWLRSPAVQNNESGLNETPVCLRYVPGLIKMKLQFRPDAEPDMAALSNILGAPVPVAPNEVISTDPSIFWTARNEWLVVLESLNKQPDRKELAKTLSPYAHAITDLSDSLAVIEISGEKSTELLSEGCGIDLHRASFNAGRYAMTRFFQLPVIIHHVGENPCFRLYVDRSSIQFLWDWLEDGARQYE